MSREIEDLIEAGLAVIDDAIQEHGPSHVFGCFSGGHDSLCATHLASRHPAFSGAFHANTGIGIEQTRAFVRETCREHNWRLVEHKPEHHSYEEMVLDMGFPSGPKSHNRMLFYLKQRAMNRLVREHKTHWKDRIGLVTGIRKGESNRRMNAAMSVPTTRNGAKLWINPILEWTADDCGRYIEYSGLRRNEVVDLLHRSGECLCGAFANHREIEEIDMWFPEAAKQIHDLEKRCRDKGLVDCKWAYPSQAPGKTWDEIDPEEVDPHFCMDCVGRHEP